MGGARPDPSLAPMTALRRNLMRRFGGYALEAGARLRPAAWPEPEERFLLFGRGRSGSTLLVDLLGSHPQVSCLGEVLRYRTRAPTAYLERRLAACATRAAGAKVLSYQLEALHQPRQIAEVRDWITRRGVRMIHMQRRNLLAHAISNLAARKTGVFHRPGGGSSAAQKIHLDAAELMAWMEGSARLLDWEEGFLEGLPREDIVYERDLETPADQARTLRRLHRIMGLEALPATSSLRRVTPRRPAGFIENWPEIVRALRRTKHKVWLDATEAGAATPG